jgi:hypothetical protein
MDCNNSDVTVEDVALEYANNTMKGEAKKEFLARMKSNREFATAIFNAITNMRQLFFDAADSSDDEYAKAKMTFLSESRGASIEVKRLYRCTLENWYRIFPNTDDLDEKFGDRLGEIFCIFENEIYEGLPLGKDAVSADGGEKSKWGL